MNELSDKELDSFLQEINKQEASELPQDLINDDAWGYGRQENKVGFTIITKPELKEKAKELQKQRIDYNYKRKQHKQKIISEAINSFDIDLYALVPIKEKKKLVSLLTNKYTELMVKQEQYINNKVNNYLQKLIPNDVMRMWSKDKDLMIPLIEFDYIASEEFGNGLHFKISADVPMYFRQEDCMNLLNEHFGDRLWNIDKAIAFFYKYKNTRTQQEVKIAQTLVNINTYYDLLKKKPFWFELLQNNIEK